MFIGLCVIVFNLDNLRVKLMQRKKDGFFFLSFPVGYWNFSSSLV